MMNQTFTNWKWVEMGGHHPKQIILKCCLGFQESKQIKITSGHNIIAMASLVGTKKSTSTFEMNPFWYLTNVYESMRFSRFFIGE